MGKDSPAAPPPPDYTGAAAATAAGNIDAARVATKANRVSQYTPYGSLTYSNIGGDPDSWQSNINLSSTGQALLDQQNRTSGNLAGLQDAATARMSGQLGQGIPEAYDPRKATNNASQLINERLAPQQARDRSSMDTQLVNQGLRPGTEAYDNAMESLGRTQNDARLQAELQGINLGQSQQAQTYQQTAANRNIPINELNAIRTGSQVTNPTFSNAPQQGQTAGPDLLGAANSQYGAAMSGYNAQQAGNSNFMSGLMGLGGQLGGAYMMSGGF